MSEVTVEITLELMNRVNEALYEAKENSQELLSTHEKSLGRTTRKNKSIAEFYDNQIKELSFLIHHTNNET